jgi:hypothetical protein
MRCYFLYCVILFMSACASRPKLRTDKFSILQGLTTPTEVELSLVAPVDKTLAFELRSADGEILKPTELKTISRSQSKWVVHKLLFIKKPNQDYNFYVFENQQLLDQRLVGKGQLNHTKLKIAVVSCMNDSYVKHFKIWEKLAENNPEYLLMLGDNVYANREANGSLLPRAFGTIPIMAPITVMLILRKKTALKKFLKLFLLNH